MKKFITFLITAFAVFILFVNPAIAIVTISDIVQTNLGNKRAIYFDVDFDSSYGWGGESLTGVSVGMQSVEKVMVQAKDGYTFEYDIPNSKIKVKSSAPPIVYEEKHTANTAGQFTLDYPAAWIINIATESGNSLWAYSGTTTLYTDEVCLPNGIDDGTRTGVSAFTPSIVYYTTYATQAWTELYNLYIENEAINMVTGQTNLQVSGNSLFAFGYMYRTTGTGQNLTPVDIGDVVADGEVGVTLFATNSAATAFDFNSSQNGNTAVVTYLKGQTDGDSWLASHLYTGVTSVGIYRAENFQKPMLMWNITGAIPALSNTTQRITNTDDRNPDATEMIPFWGMYGFSGGTTPYTSVGSGASLYRARFDFGGENSGVSIRANYTFGHPWEIPNLKHLEVKNGSDLSALTGVQVMMIGY